MQFKTFHAQHRVEFVRRTIDRRSQPFDFAKTRLTVAHAVQIESTRPTVAVGTEVDKVAVRTDRRRAFVGF